MTRRPRADLARKVARLEGVLDPGVCRCGVEWPARNVVMSTPSPPADVVCPDCGLEQIVVLLHFDTPPPRLATALADAVVDTGTDKPFVDLTRLSDEELDELHARAHAGEGAGD